MSPREAIATLRGVSPTTVLLVVVGGGLLIRPNPVWSMLFYLTVLPLCGGRLARREGWPADPGGIAGVALILWFTLATAWDEAAGLHIGAHAIWVWNGLCTLVFFVAARTAFGAPGIARERLITTLIACGLANTAIVFVRTAFTGIADGRLAGWAETRHPILGASVIGVCVLLSAARLVAGRTRWLAAAQLAGGLAFIVLTGSRGPLVAIGVALPLLLAMLRPRLLAIALAVALGLLVVLALGAPGLLDHVWQRLMERGWSSRLDIWQLALQEIAHRPVLGYGPSARLDRAVDNFPHNLFLSTAFYSGAIGLALLLFLLALAARGALRQPDIVARATCLALLAHLVLSGVTDLSQVTKGPSPIWYIVWLPIILALGPARQARGARSLITLPVDARPVHFVERSGP